MNHNHVHSDELLLRACAAGDAGAFSTLYDRASGRAFGLITSLVKSRGDAEDVLQETFWHVWKSAATYNPSLGSGMSWILMIARSRAIDRLRRRRRDAEDVSVLEDAPGERGAGLPETRESTWATVLDALPEEQRHAIMLAYWRGMSREQIALVQGVPVGTVKTRIRSGLARMRESVASGSVRG